ncbi:protein of unknown function [Nitrospira defluvii]|uniref:Uncharacterized protein n=1 Tax=Nitrospira defluvii TaxID=330214 RepID=D8PH06_9BACT|nr:protein of unknown function [Nitrospira defluvii]
MHVRFGERACETAGRKTGMARMSYSNPYIPMARGVSNHAKLTPVIM